MRLRLLTMIAGLALAMLFAAPLSAVAAPDHDRSTYAEAPTPDDMPAEVGTPIGCGLSHAFDLRFAVSADANCADMNPSTREAADLPSPERAEFVHLTIADLLRLQEPRRDALRAIAHYSRNATWRMTPEAVARSAPPRARSGPGRG